MSVCDDGSKAEGVDAGWDSWSGGWRRYQGSSTCRILQIRYGQVPCFTRRVLRSVFDSITGNYLLSSSLPVIDNIEQKVLCQLHQVFISCDFQQGLNAGSPERIQTLNDQLGKSCKTVFLGQPVQVSAIQQHVSNTLWGMGLSVEDEFRCPKSGYSIDMRVYDMHTIAKSGTGAASGWSVEFDGPSHF